MNSPESVDSIERYNNKLKQISVLLEFNIDFQQSTHVSDYRLKVHSRGTGKYLYTKIFSTYDDVIRHLKKITKKGIL